MPLDSYLNHTEGMLWFVFIGGMFLVVIQTLISDWKNK